MTYSDAGRYSCVLGPQIQKVELLVENPEDVALELLRMNAYISPSIPADELRLGDNLMLNCGISNSDNNYNIKWEKVRDFLPSNVKTSGIID